MTTLELSKKNWNTQYLQYDSEKWNINFKYYSGGINIEAYYIPTGDMRRNYGFFDAISIRTSLIPTYVSKYDIEVWN